MRAASSETVRTNYRHACLNPMEITVKGACWARDVQDGTDGILDRDPRRAPIGVVECG